MNRKRIVKTTMFIAIGMLIYFVYSYIMRRFILHENSFKYYFLFMREDKFMDFFNVNGFVFDRNPYIKGTSYPPIALIFSYIFTFFNRHDYLKGVLSVRGSALGYGSYLALFVTATIIIFHLIYNKFQSEDTDKKYSKVELFCISSIILFSAPYLILVDRGNYLIIAMIFFFIFVFNYDKNDIVAAICIAIVASMKIYPIVFIILFVLDKKIKPLFISIIVGASITILSFGFFKGGYFKNVILFFENLRSFTQLGTLPSNWYNVSLKTLIEIPLTGFSKLQPYTNIPNIDRGILISSQNIKIENFILIILTAILSVVTILILKYEKQHWKRILCITIFMITGMGSSYEYNLVYLVPSLILFLTNKDNEKHENIIIGFFTLLLIPKAYYYINGSLIGIQCFLDPIILFLFTMFFFISDIIMSSKMNYKVKK